MSKIVSFKKEVIKLDDSKEVILRKALESDIDDIKDLYYKVYGGKYSLPEVTNRDKMKWIINDPNYLWLIMELKNDIIGSVIFVTDSHHLIGKAFGGVVAPEFRGHKLLKIAMKKGLDYLMQETRLCDLVYGVVRTFAPLSFHEDLKELGFVDLGIFPNVRKLHRYETHGLKVNFHPEALKNRKDTPELIPAANKIYEIIRNKLGLDAAVVDTEPYKSLNKYPSEKIKLFIERSAEIEWEYYEQRDRGELIFDFFPFHHPQLKLYTKDFSTEVFVHFQEIDGHASILGIKTDIEDLTVLLISISEYLESMGIKYLEVLTKAYQLDFQRQLFRSNFLPCAYFPAAKRKLSGAREDYVVFCRCFVPLNFQGLHFTPDIKPYAQAFYQIYSEKLWEDLEKA